MTGCDGHQAKQVPVHNKKVSERMPPVQPAMRPCGITTSCSEIMGVSAQYG